MAKQRVQPKKKADRKNRIKARTRSASTQLSQDDQHKEDNEVSEKRDPVQNVERREPVKRTVIQIDDIQPRPEGNTRELSPDHVVDLAESISALGLLEPIVIDTKGHLLAGEHRLTALRLLKTPTSSRAAFFKEKFEEASEKLMQVCLDRIEELEPASEKFDRVPTHIIDFDATKDVERALAIEAAENTQRKGYTAKEVFEIYNKLLKAGYTDKKGRPSKHEKAAKPAVAVIIGRSLKTVSRILQKQQEEKEHSPVTELERALSNLERGITHFKKAALLLDDPELTEELSKSLNNRIEKAIRNTRKALQDKK